MQKHRHYLDAKYKSKITEIDAHRNNGSVFKCHSCDYDSMLANQMVGAISSANCIVCSTIGKFISLDCPDDRCHQKIIFDVHEGPPEYCPSCNNPFADWVRVGLDTSMTSLQMPESRDLNCPYCWVSGYHTVVEHYDHYICTSCFEYSKTIGICEWCSEGQLGGVSEFSYSSGCSICGGQSGWDANKG